MKISLPDFIKSNSGDFWVLSAKWTAPIFSLVSGLITARYLAPEELGVIQTVMLIATYAGFLQFGVFNGLNRNLPMYIARGEPEKALRYVNASRTTARWVGCIGAIVALISSCLFYQFSSNILYTHVCIFLIPGMYFGPQRLHLETVFRGTKSFEKYGKSLHLQNILIMTCAGLTAIFGVYIAAFRYALSSIFGYLYLRKDPPLPSTPTASFSQIKSLAKVGFPMMVSGQIYTWLNASDRTIIAARLPAEELGLFALASMVMTSLSVFPSTINLLLYPRVAQAYGASNSSRALRPYIWISFAINLSLLIPIALIGWFALPTLVHNFLPRYTGGIPAARIILIGGVFMSSSGPSVIIPILRKNLPLQLAGLVAIAVVWVLGLWAIENGFGIEGVALARITATAFYACFTFFYVFYLTSKDVQCSA